MNFDSPLLPLAKPKSRRSRRFFVVSFHPSCSRPPRRGCPTSPQFPVQHPLAEVEDALLRDRLNALAWLAAAGFLQIRLAVRVDADGNISRGIFHEKTGIFTDPRGEHVAFTGSANETAGGLVENFESLEVFPSWQDRDGRVDAKIADFEALWSDSTPGLRTFDFSQAGAELLAAFRDPANPPPGLPPHLLDDLPAPGDFRPPRHLELRDYQTEANFGFTGTTRPRRTTDRLWGA